MLRAGALVLQGEAEGPELVQPRDEKAFRGPKLLKGKVITKMEPGFAQRCVVG